MHRWTRIGLEVVLGIVAGVVVLTGFLAWRLSEGPVPLSFLTPRLEAALVQSEGQVSIEETFLVWDDERSSLDLRVRGLSFRDAEGRQSLYLPESNLAFSVRALLRGRLELVGLEILGAEVSLLRLEDGGFAWRTPDEGDGSTEGEVIEDEGAPPSSGQLWTLLVEEDQEGPFGQLGEIRLLDTLVTLEDRQQGLFWTMPAEEIVLAREARGLVGEASMALELDGQRAPLSLVFAYGRERGLIDISAEIVGLSLPKLALLVPELSELARLDAEVAGNLNATLAPRSDLALIDFDLTVGSGQLRLREAGAPPLPVRSGRLTGFYDGGAERLSVDRLELASGTADDPGATFGLGGTFQPAPGGTGRLAEFSFDIDSIDVWDLVELWPPEFSPGGLEWVEEHFLTGVVENLTGQVAVLFPEASGSRDGNAVLQSIEGRFEVRQATVDYHPPLPATSNLAVAAAFDDESLRFRTAPTELGGVMLEPVALWIYDFESEIQQMRIEIEGSGDLQTVLAMIDQPPFGLVSAMGIAPAATSGAVAFDLTLDFPLLEEVGLNDFGYQANATLSGFRLREAVAGQDLTADSLALAISREGTEIAGDVVVAGAPLYLTWRAANGFSSVSARISELSAATVVDLVPALEGRLGGSLAGSLDLSGRPGGDATLSGDFDLGGASLDLPDLQWEKAAGTGGSVRFTAELGGGSLQALRPFALQAPGLLVEGEMAFAPDGGLTRAVFSRLETEEQALRNVVAEPWFVDGTSGWKLGLGGGILDLRPWLERVELGQSAQVGMPLALTAPSLERVLFPGGWIDGPSLSLVRGVQGLASLDLNGQLQGAEGAGGQLAMSLGTDAQGVRRMRIESSDMGRLLAVLGIAEGVDGGRLTIAATGTAPGPDAPMVGTVEGSGFRLVEAPVLAQILLVASLTGIGDVLAGEGIPFERLTGDIAFHRGVLSSELLKAYGSSLGITAKGEVDFGADVIDIEGSIVPAYAVNQVLGDIPLVGWLLTGGEGGGLLAVSYGVSGTVTDPQISVNPLSAITPGFLRGLFDLFEGDGSPPPPTLYPEGPTR